MSSKSKDAGHVKIAKHNEEYQEILALWKADASSVREEINDPRFSSLTKTMGETVFIIYLYEIYKKLIFFSTTEDIKILRNSKLKKNELKWFISINQIEDEFKKIEAKGILINKLSAIALIKIYFESKFANDLLLRYNFTVERKDKTVWTKVTKDLFELKRRREYGGGKPKSFKNEYEMHLNNKVDESLKMTGVEGSLDYIIELSKGNGEKNLLRTLVEDCFVYDTEVINQTAFLSNIYGLCKLIMQGHNLPEDEDILDKNVNRSKAAKIKKIILSK